MSGRVLYMHDTVRTGGAGERRGRGWLSWNGENELAEPMAYKQTPVGERGTASMSVTAKRSGRYTAEATISEPVSQHEDFVSQASSAADLATSSFRTEHRAKVAAEAMTQRLANGTLGISGYKGNY